MLSFAADWCPCCRADLKDISANGSQLKNVTIVVVDYDKDKAFKNRFGVTYQDTLAQIDATAMKLSIWNGGGVEGILQHAKEM